MFKGPSEYERICRENLQQIQDSDFSVNEKTGKVSLGSMGASKRVDGSGLYFNTRGPKPKST